jgi:hypothetical protein
MGDHRSGRSLGHRWDRLGTVVGVAIVILIVVIVVPRSDQHRPTTLACVYSRLGVPGLTSVAPSLGFQPQCALAFGGGADWASWIRPYFTDPNTPTSDWAEWIRDNPRRTAVVTYDLLPTGLESTPDWRQLGAAGQYAGYARELAASLVNAGLGHAYLRLGNEPNGSWANDGIGTTSQDWTAWRTFWDRTVTAMKEVPGAHFNFVWCVAPGFGDVRYSAYYPGDRYVNTIGMDVYDSGFSYAGPNRWSYLLDRTTGINSLVSFASRHHKPLAVPEWGLVPTALGGDGDDVDFVHGLSKLIATHDVAFQGYFDAGTSELTDPATIATVQEFERRHGNMRQG